jgi:hypothetical protein
MFFKLGHIPLSWTSKLQPMVVLSNIKLEYKSLLDGAKNIA